MTADWLHMDLTKPPVGLPGDFVSYTFPDDGAGGQSLSDLGHGATGGVNAGPSPNLQLSAPKFRAA
jgi:hypothetical protein